jgi:hypothetical protein
LGYSVFSVEIQRKEAISCAIVVDPIACERLPVTGDGAAYVIAN